MSAVDLITVGEAFEDFVFFGLPRMPNSGEEIKTNHFLRTHGGGAVITAVAAARLGVRCSILSGLSGGTVEMLHQEGVDVRNLRREYEPHAITVSLSTAENRTFVTFNGMNDLLEARLIGALPGVSAKHVHFALQPADCRRWVGVVSNLQSRGTTVSWDFGWSDALSHDGTFKELIAALDFLLVNEEEAMLYAGQDSLEASVSYFKTHARQAVIKCGSRGVRSVSTQADVLVPGRKVQAVDSTGAGDAFNGGFLYAMLTGLPLRECLELGNSVGAFSTTMAGGIDGLPRRAQLA